MGEFDALDGVLKELGNGMSKAAGDLIANQLVAETVRTKEIPEQLGVLHAALVQNVPDNRVVVIVDELDRCHPDYAISFLEAMSLVFRDSPFVFCLMINADYLEALAKHRFGTAQNDEKYLDKFVDIRLGLGPKEDAFKNAVYSMAMDLPLAIPFGEDKEFSVERAAELAAELAVHTGLSMRKVKRILLKVEVALRCHTDRPLDVPLLIFLAFRDVVGDKVEERFLPRSFVTPESAATLLNQDGTPASARRAEQALMHHGNNVLINEKAPELTQLPRDRYGLPDERDYYEWAMVLKYLAPYYIPTHRAVLDAVASLVVREKEEVSEVTMRHSYP